MSYYYIMSGVANVKANIKVKGLANTIPKHRADGKALCEAIGLANIEAVAVHIINEKMIPTHHVDLSVIMNIFCLSSYQYNFLYLLLFSILP